jgi:CBS domain-containing protein
MICPSCRSENIEGADLCSNCGESFWPIEVNGGKDRILPALEEPLNRLSGREVTRIQTTDPLSLAVRMMQEKNESGLMVFEGDRLAGILTAWDLVYKAGASTQDLGAIRCSEIMTADPIVFKDEERIAAAINKMAVGEFRHIPISHGEATYTIIDSKQIFEFISPYLV